MKYKITFKTENAEHTIAELGENALENTLNILETLLNAEDYETEELGSLYDLGLGFYPVPYDGTKRPSSISAISFQLVGLGPRFAFTRTAPNSFSLIGSLVSGSMSLMMRHSNDSASGSVSF